MSTEWDFHCKTCDEYSEDLINRGDHVLESIFRLRHHIAAIKQEDTTGYLEVTIMAHGDAFIDFIVKHHDHEIELHNEYGQTREIADG